MADAVRGPDAAHEVLLAASRLTLDEKSAERLRRAAPKVDDWEALLALARRHRVVPLVARHLASADARVPPQARDAFTGAARAVQARALMMASRTVEIVRALRDRGVRALPYKG